MADKVLVHQDVYGFKAGETVPASKFDKPTLRWLIGAGYASTEKSRETDHADIQTEALLADRPEEEGPERKLVQPGPPENAGTTTPEAFDPTTRTVGEVEAYLERIPEGAGRDQEKARIKAVEARDGDDRKGIAEL